MVPGQFEGQAFQALRVIQAADEGAEAREDRHSVGTPYARVLHHAVTQAGKVREVLIPGVRVGLEETARAHRE